MTGNALVFTTHKAASSLLFNVLRSVSTAQGRFLYSPNLNGAEFGVADHRKNNFADDRRFESQPCIVGPLRRPGRLIHLPGAKRIIHLRDPRDIMTSMFFSWAYSHKGIDDAQRQKLINMGIDNFVTEMHGDMRDRFNIYCDWLKADDSIIFLTYEDLYDDYAGWLTKLFAALSIEDHELVDEIVKRSDPQLIVARGENRDSHMRQAKPGDHLRKLAPETIRMLDRAFDFYLDFYEKRKN